MVVHSSMTSRGSVELKCTIDTELPWKMVAKGSRSSTRRNKKSGLRVAASDIETQDKNSTGKVTEESQPEKHFAEGVEHVPIKKRRSTAGSQSPSKSSAQCEGSGVRVAASDIELEDKSSTGKVTGESQPEKHFAEGVEHVPIKKRRFMALSQSPSKSSAQCEVSEHRAQINQVLPVSRLNPNLTNGRTPVLLNEKPDCSGDEFSGIKILADVACSSDVSNDLAPAVESLPAEEPIVQQQDASTISTHAEGNDSSAGTADVSQKYTAVDPSDQAEQSKDGIVATQKSLFNDLADEQKVEHSRVASEGMKAAKNINITLSDESSTGRPKADMVATKTENVAPDSGAVTVSKNSSADELTDKNNESLKDVRFHWDLNVPIDAWGQPCAVEDEASGRDLEGETKESVAPKGSKAIDGSKDHMNVVVASDGQANSSSLSEPKADEAAARNGKECQSGYDSQFEDGELREPYPWEETDGDAGEEVEQLDYGSEPEDERFYSIVESYDNKMEDSEKGILTETKFGPVKCESGDARSAEANEGRDIEKHVVVYTRDSHPKKGSSSPSRSFGSKPFKELPSHDPIQRRRPGYYEELNTGPDKFVGRDDGSGMRMRNRSPGRGFLSGWDSKRHFSPRNYKGDSYGFGRPRPKSIDDRGMMNGFDQPGPDGQVRRQFSNGGYRGRFRRFPDGGDRDFRGPQGDTNQFPGRMNNRMSGNRRDRGNSPVFRRLNYPQSELRSRSRSPVSWNGRNRSPPGGFRAEDRMMERVRLPFQKRYPADEEMGFMSPPRNRMSSPRFFERRNNDAGENYNSFRERKFRPEQRFDAGNSMRRQNSNNSHHFRPFIRHRRFDNAEENRGGNRFDMPQQQRTRQSEAMEDSGVRRFRFNGEQSVEVANNNNNNES